MHTKDAKLFLDFALMVSKFLRFPTRKFKHLIKKEAVEEIAAYNSEFAQKNPDTLLFTKYNISGDDLAKFNLGYEVKQNDFSVGTDKLFASESDATDIKKMLLTQFHKRIMKYLLVLVIFSDLEIIG